MDGRRAARESEQQHIAQALRQVPLFATLSDDQLAALARVARRHRYDRDAVIFYQEDPGNAFYVILSGEVKVTVSSAEGQEAILVMLEAGESFGELALLDDQPRSATIQATRPTEVLALRRQDFVALLEQTPAMAIQLLKVLARRLRATDELVEDAAFLDVAARLAKKLLALMESHGRATPLGIELDLDLPQRELAAMIGATRESVNKQMGVLREQGLLIANRHRITIVQPEGLRARLNRA